MPTLKDGDVVVNESLAAIIYLEETYAPQGTPLLPPLDKPDARALVSLRFRTHKSRPASISQAHRMRSRTEAAAGQTPTTLTRIE